MGLKGVVEEMGQALVGSGEEVLDVVESELGLSKCFLWLDMRFTIAKRQMETYQS